MGKIKAVIFDWSGVLCDDFDAVYAGDMAVFDAFGLPKISTEEYRRTIELPWQDFYKKKGITDVEKISAVFRKAFAERGNVRPLPGALEALRELHGKGLKIAVLSAKSQDFLKQECAEFGFGGFIGTLETHFDKRKGVNGLVEKLGAKKSEVVFVGDMVHDVETARHGGIISVAVLNGHNSRERLLQAKPDYCIESIGELANLVGKINGECNGKKKN